MACAVAGRLWEEEVGGRPPKTILEPSDRKRKTVVRDTTVEKRRRKCSPFRPWTPEQELKIDQEQKEVRQRDIGITTPLELIEDKSGENEQRRDWEAADRSFEIETGRDGETLTQHEQGRDKYSKKIKDLPPVQDQGRDGPAEQVRDLSVVHLRDRNVELENGRRISVIEQDDHLINQNSTDSSVAISGYEPSKTTPSVVLEGKPDSSSSYSPSGYPGGSLTVRRNYKNMTRERRIEANARERTRVHTISAAFDNLRKAVPAYSHNQKLSKLAVLRVAASYILTLSRIIDEDYSADGSAPSLQSCVESITSTIQMEGRLKKKKDE